MIRITTIFLCVLLAAAAFGRYRAEVSVRELHQDIERLRTSQADEQRSIQMLRAEIAYLENPERLAKIAEATTGLRPSEGEQLVDAQEFAELLGADDIEIPADREQPVRQALADAPPSVR